MRYIFYGDIDSLTSAVRRIRFKGKYRIFMTDSISQVKIYNNLLLIESTFCVAKAVLKEESDHIIIDLKVKFKLAFRPIGIILIIFLSCFIFADNVTINGEFDPPLWKRIGFTMIGFLPLSFIAYKLSRIPKRFENELKTILKTEK